MLQVDRELRVEERMCGLISVMHLHDPNEHRALTALDKVAHFVPDALLHVRLKRFVPASRDLCHPFLEPRHLVGVNSIEVHGQHALTSRTKVVITIDAQRLSGSAAARSAGRWKRG